MNERDPILFCLCGPSGAGKSTISRELLKTVPKLALSISATSRVARAGEIEAVHYYFISSDAFERDIASDRFLEWAVYNENKYGTPRKNIEEATAKNEDLLLDIDVQGAQRLKELLPAQVVVVSIFAPSFKELRQRLEDRASEGKEIREKRLKRAQEEIEVLSKPEVSDYIVFNAGLEKAIEEINAIIIAERCRLSRMSQHFLSKLSA